MCTGASLLYKIKTSVSPCPTQPEYIVDISRVLVGENVNFSSFAEQVMRDQGVKVCLLQDSHCIQMMKTFIQENTDLWKEDVHEIE